MAVAEQQQIVGKLVRIAGPMVEADGMLGVGMASLA